MAAAIFLMTTVALTSGCAGRFIQGEVIHSESKIRNTAENRSVVELVESYQQSIQHMDIETLREIISRDYYENAGTTHTTDDDYGYDGVTRLLESIAKHVNEARLSVKVRDIRVYGERADVIFEYAYTMMYEVGGDHRWQTERDINRIQLQLEDGAWRIVSGL